MVLSLALSLFFFKNSALNESNNLKLNTLFHTLWFFSLSLSLFLTVQSAMVLSISFFFFLNSALNESNKLKVSTLFDPLWFVLFRSSPPLVVYTPPPRFPTQLSSAHFPLHSALLRRLAAPQSTGWWHVVLGTELYPPSPPPPTPWDLRPRRYLRRQPGPGSPVQQREPEPVQFICESGWVSRCSTVRSPAPQAVQGETSSRSQHCLHSLLTRWQFFLIPPPPPPNPVFIILQTQAVCYEQGDQTESCLWLDPLCFAPTAASADS